MHALAWLCVLAGLSWGHDPSPTQELRSRIRQLARADPECALDAYRLGAATLTSPGLNASLLTAIAIVSLSLRSSRASASRPRSVIS